MAGGDGGGGVGGSNPGQGGTSGGPQNQPSPRTRRTRKKSLQRPEQIGFGWDLENIPTKNHNTKDKK